MIHLFVRILPVSDDVTFLAACFIVGAVVAVLVYGALNNDGH